MPAVTSGKVLITGESGFVAIWIVKHHLDRGYSVRATVRSDAKAEDLKEIFSDHGDKLETVIVPDMAVDGAFDEAVKGVDAIHHTASPFHFRATTVDELVTPAVSGALGVLKSAQNCGTNVQRIVFLSSTVAVIPPTLSRPTTDLETYPHLLKEENWNEWSIDEIKTKGDGAGPVSIYSASKALAEKAVWKFYEEQKARVKWDVVSLNPPLIFGPILHKVECPESLNESMTLWNAMVIKGPECQDILAHGGNVWVDARDVAAAHLAAMEKEEVGGRRFILAARGNEFKWQDWVNIVHGIDPNLPTGDASYRAQDVVHYTQVATSKAQDVLDWHPRSMKDSAADILADFKAKGWVKAQ